MNLFIQDVGLQKPERYNSFNISELETKYSPAVSAQKKPNIIVIMNEVFCDLRIYNNSLNTNQPVTPFFDSLSENTVRGNVLASIFGGGTSNSEYEFLTGNTLGFLPKGANGYQQYLENGSYSLNSYFRSLGYKTVAMHPHYASSWMRSTVWSWLGFDEIYFRDGVSFSEDNHIRGWISDIEMYDKILQALAEKPSDSPLFLFGVTVQNHGGYDDEEFISTVSLEGYSQEYPLTEQYLSLLKESDSALEYLLTQLTDTNEEVVVLFYGDHQPKIESSFYEELNGERFEDLQAIQKQYTVPFIIWANYDIQESTVPLYQFKLSK